MPKTIKGLLIGATKLPVAIEGKLPAGAPKISQIMINTANRLPDGPALPVDIPELPEPKLPDMPKFGGGGAAAALGLAPRPSGTRGRLTATEQPPMASVGSRGKL